MLSNLNNNPWNFQEKKSSDYFEDVLKYGWWVIHARGDDRLPCSCVDDNGEPAPFCTLCWGVGYKVVFSKQLVRRSWADAPRSYADLDVLTLPGIQRSTLSDAYYMRATSKPHERDLIIEVDWDRKLNYVQHYGKPAHVNLVSVVTHAEPNRMADFIYYTVAVRNKDTNHEWLNKLTLTLGTELTHD